MTTIRLTVPFAVDGQRTPIDTTRPDGVVNLEQGYGDDYSRELGVDPSAKAIERDKMNWLLNILSTNMIDWQVSAFPQWISQTQYAPPSFVRYTAGITEEKVYRCLVTPPIGTVPTNTDFWEEVPPNSVLRNLIPMPFRSMIIAPTDFNTFVTNGTWTFSQDNIGGTYPNSPANSISDMLEVRLTTNGANTLMQRYSDVAGGRYARGRNSSGAWSAWITETYPVPIAQGGTGATTAAQARTNLGLGTVATYNVGTLGATVPLLNNQNGWSQTQFMESGSIVIRGANGNANAGTLQIGNANAYLHYDGSRWLLYNPNTTVTTEIAGGGVTWTSGNFDPGTKVNRGGDTMTGNLTAPGVIANLVQGLRVEYANGTQGFQFMWNENGVENGYGVNEYVNNYGGGGGGHFFYSRGVKTDALYRSASISRTGNITGYPSNVNPGNGAGTLALIGRGSYGGGVGLIDGTDTIGFYSNFGVLNIGFATGGAGVALASRLSLDKSGNMVTSGTYQSGSSITSLANGFVTRGSGSGVSVYDRVYGDRYWSNYSSDMTQYWWANGVGNLMWLTQGGQLNTAGGFNYGSSMKLKDVVSEVEYTLDDLLGIDLFMGTYKPEYNPDGVLRIFHSAESLLEVAPETVDPHSVPFNGEKVAGIKIDQLQALQTHFIKLLDHERRKHAEIQKDQAEELRELRGMISDLRLEMKGYD